MSFRTRLLLVITVTVALSVGLVAWQVSTNVGAAFNRLDQERSQALVSQFQREFTRRGGDVKTKIDSIAAGEVAARMVIDLSRPNSDPSPYVNSARDLAAQSQLDFLEFLSSDTTIISSAQWPARFGYRDASVDTNAAPSTTPFLSVEETPDASFLAIVSTASIHAGSSHIYAVGGRKLDSDFLKSLTLPSGMRVLMYRYSGASFNDNNLVTTGGSFQKSEKLAPLVERVKKEHDANRPATLSEAVPWSNDAADSEIFQTIPLTGRRNELLGVLLVGSPQKSQVELARHISAIGFIVAGGGIILGLLLSAGISARITRPLEQLAVAAREVAHGNWNTSVAVNSHDEIGELAQAFNKMTSELVAQRERLLQTERVAAWRELARRLAHELKNPLFPLQLTVENLLRARDQSPEQFDEVFRESTATLLAEIANLKTIIGRFSDFSKMPAPQLLSVDLNELVEEVARLFQAQFKRPGAAAVNAKLQLAPGLPSIQADPILLRRAIENLVLNALDAMPNGGVITFRTQCGADRVVLEIADTGSGLTAEECERLFTPYYTTKQFGTGLGLAIVQSVISDHGGRITVSSQKGSGTLFHVELPVSAAMHSANA
jgi:signal transduction histidine kinase